MSFPSIVDGGNGAIGEVRQAVGPGRLLLDVPRMAVRTGPGRYRPDAGRPAGLTFAGFLAAAVGPPSSRPSHAVAGATAASEGGGFVPRPANSSLPYDGVIQSAARVYNVDPSLVRAVVKAESNFDPSAVSKAGAKGLMQLMPGTASAYGVTNPFDPVQSVFAGTAFLGSLLRRFGGDVTRALAAYNAGPGAVETYHGVPPYPETQRYVGEVLNYQKEMG